MYQIWAVLHDCLSLAKSLIVLYFRADLSVSLLWYMSILTLDGSRIGRVYDAVREG